MPPLPSAMRLLALITLSISAHAYAAQPISAAQIDTLVQRSMKTFDVPGIAVAIIKDDQVVHAKGYGVRSLKSQQGVDTQTLFGIASNSKAFTAAALAMLVDEKKIKWTDKVTEYLPEFKMYNPYVTEEFTILDLLTHRSGLGLGAGDLMFFPDGSDFTRADVIRNLRYLKPTSSFRSQYDYDNNLYIVAGEVVARASGMAWEAFIEQRILQPLGMNQSAASLGRLKDRSNAVDPHVAIDGKVQAVEVEPSDVSNAAGGIYSNLTDMSLWVRMQLAAGKYGDGKRLFSEAEQHTMWTPHTIIPVPPGPNAYNTHFAGYGLGWGLRDLKGYKQVSHTGGLTGMVTQVILIPELRLGIVVLTNQQQDAAFSSISNTIKDAYLGMPATDHVAEMSKKLVKRTAAADKKVQQLWQTIATKQQQAGKAQHDLAPYAGTYRDNWFGDVKLTLDNGKLVFVSKRSPKLSGEMSYYKATTFIVKWRDRSFDADAFVNFSLGHDGKPQRMTMAAISPLTDFSYDFQDLDFQAVK